MVDKDHLFTNDEYVREINRKNKILNSQQFAVTGPAGLGPYVIGTGLTSRAEPIQERFEGRGNPIKDFGTVGLQTVNIDFDDLGTKYNRFKVNDDITFAFNNFPLDQAMPFIFDIEITVANPIITYPASVKNLPSNLPTDSGSRYDLLFWGFKDENEERFYVIGGEGTATIPAGTVENEHLEWDNTALIWIAVQASTYGATGPFADNGFLRFANNQIMLSGRNQGNDGNVELKSLDSVGNGALDITDSGENTILLQLRAQDAVNADVSMSLSQDPQVVIGQAPTLFTFPFTLAINRGSDRMIRMPDATNVDFFEVSDMFGFNLAGAAQINMGELNALVYKGFGTPDFAGKSISRFATGLHYDLEATTHTHTFRIGNATPLTMLELSRANGLVLGNITVAGSAALQLLNNNQSPAGNGIFFFDGTDLKAKTGGSTVNLSDVAGSNFTDVNFRVHDEINLTADFKINLDGATNATAATLDFNQTANRTYTFPGDGSGEVIITPSRTDLDMSTFDIFGVDIFQFALEATLLLDTDVGITSTVGGDMQFNILNLQGFTFTHENTPFVTMDHNSSIVKIETPDGGQLQLSRLTAPAGIAHLAKFSGNVQLNDPVEVNLAVAAVNIVTVTSSGITMADNKFIANVDQIGFRITGNIIQDDAGGMVFSTPPTDSFTFDDGTDIFATLDKDLFAIQFASIQIPKIAQPPDPGATDDAKLFWNSADNRMSFLRRNDADTAFVVIDLEAGSGASPLTTKGDVFGFSTVDARIPVGTNNQVFMADSVPALGVKYAFITNANLASGDFNAVTGIGTQNQTLAMGDNSVAQVNSLGFQDSGGQIQGATVVPHMNFVLTGNSTFRFTTNAVNVLDITSTAITSTGPLLDMNGNNITMGAGLIDTESGDIDMGAGDILDVGFIESIGIVASLGVFRIANTGFVSWKLVGVGNGDFSVDANDDFLWRLNTVSQMTLSGSELNLQNNKLANVNPTTITDFTTVTGAGGDFIWIIDATDGLSKKVDAADFLGAGSQTPWLQNIDADGFDLFDLSNIEFRDTTGAPAAGIRAIYADANDMIFNVPTGDGFQFKRNNIAQVIINSSGNLGLQDNTIIDVGKLTFNSGGASDAAITPVGAGGLEINVHTGTKFEINITGSTPFTKMTIDSAKITFFDNIDLNARSVRNINELAFLTDFVTISQIGSRLEYNVPAFQLHRFRVNTLIVAEFDDTLTKLTDVYLEMDEVAAPGAGIANTARVFFEDNGSGKTRMMVQFQAGAAQQIAIQP